MFGTIFCRSDNWFKKERYPRELFHHCCSAYGRHQALHSKVIAAMLDNDRSSWWYIGSHNFTPSAWGKFVKEKSAVMIANYELGVIITADDEGKCSISPSAGRAFPYPYQRPVRPYDLEHGDVPWMQDLINAL
jgi:tyrosyl-DNA phosphodiesterase-1